MFVLQRFCFICDITLSVWLVTCRGCVSYSLFQRWFCWDLQSYGFILMCAWIELTYEQLECFLSFESLEVIYISVHRHTHTGFLGGSVSKESACSARDLGLIPGLGRSPGEGHGNPLQHSWLENPHGQRSLMTIVHEITKSLTRLGD